MTAVALTIAGSDSGGGAGIQADLKTFSALGVYGASAVTALTAQNTQGVSAVHVSPPSFVRAQMDAVLSDLSVDAVKIGMLADDGIVLAVAEGLSAFPGIPVVLDPVMAATSGDALLSKEAVSALKEVLMRRADLLTPNLHEAARLVCEPLAASDADMERQAERLLSYGARAVLLKGGHRTGNEARDFYTDGNERFFLSSPRYESHNTHGTGCTLSAAIAANLARGKPMRAALEAAKSYVSAAIAAADRLAIRNGPEGKGHGPVHHFHRLWQD